jgi:small-conductance mechanosensitive channel
MRGPFFQLVGPEHAVQVFGVKLVGLTPDTGRKLLLTLAAAVLAWALGQLLRLLLTLALRGRQDLQARFWSRQAVHLACTLLFLLTTVSIWFSDPGRLSTAFGLVSAGLAFALQRVITAVAGYFVILRGRLFNVGDRIVMGGVRGDVIALGYIRTTVMEMGQAPEEQGDNPSMWVRARQYTGRIVTVTNDKIFDEPIYNYTRGFPYLWEEMHLPIPYTADRKRAEEIILHAVERYAAPKSEMSEEDIRELQRRYFLGRAEVDPRVYYRLTDNWLEMTVRFVVKEHGIREVKDRISRDLLDAFDEAGIGIASATFEIVGLPKLQVEEVRGNR